MSVTCLGFRNLGLEREPLYLEHLLKGIMSSRLHASLSLGSSELRKSLGFCQALLVSDPDPCHVFPARGLWTRDLQRAVQPHWLSRDPDASFVQEGYWRWNPAL